MTGPLSPLLRWRARRAWLRRPAAAARLLDRAGPLSPDLLGLRAWLALVAERDEAGAERRAREALARSADARFASAALAEVLLRAGRRDEAVEVVRCARAARPDVRWYDLTLADALEEAGRVGEAREVLEAAAGHDRLRRHALKRLSRLALAAGDRDGARGWFEQLIGLAPDYLVYASDYETLIELQLEAGDADGARATWREAAKVYGRHAGLRALRERHFPDEPPMPAPRIAAVSEGEMGVRRLPIRTPMISARTGLLEVIGPATAEARRPGDVLALAESAAAAGQGRLLALELFEPDPLARTLSRFVGEVGPLHSHEGMQGAIMEAGRARILAGTVLGALGKLVGRRGWFYRVAGPRTAMIDDVAACIPPHDHHVIFGPLDADGLAASLAGALGCAVAVVDANHKTGAWVVGASGGVDREWVQEALRDNPAGNEDEQTPVVLVRREGAAGAPGAAAPSAAVSG